MASLFLMYNKYFWYRKNLSCFSCLKNSNARSFWY